MTSTKVDIIAMRRQQFRKSRGLPLNTKPELLDFTLFDMLDMSFKATSISNMPSLFDVLGPGDVATDAENEEDAHRREQKDTGANP